MSSLKDNKTCALLEQYLSYLTVVKGRSPLTAEEYRVDCNMLFEYIKRKRGIPQEILIKRDFSDVDIDFIKSISIGLLDSDKGLSGVLLLSIITKANGEYIGYCGFVDDNELLYGLKQSAWKKGYGLEVAKATLHYGFTVLQLPFIVATVNPQNIASEKILIKIGMAYADEYFRTNSAAPIA